MDCENFVKDIQQSNSVTEQIRIIEQYSEFFNENREKLIPLLDKLKPEVYVIPYAAILCKSSNKNILVEKSNFIFKNVTGSFTRKAHLIVRSLSAEYVNYLIESNKPRSGIKILLKLISAVQTSKEILTIYHPDLLQLCLASYYFEPALDLMSTPVLDFDKNNTQTSKDFLMTFYYLGSIYCALKRYKDALQQFELALLIPAYNPNQLYLSILKKTILVSIIINGNYECKHHENLIKPYIELVKAFESSKRINLEAVILEHQNTFVNDQNFGLVKQLRVRLIKFEIIRFTKTYLTMNLTDLASQLGIENLSDLELLLVEMINEREIFAKIDKLNGTINFFDDPEDYESSAILLKINEKISKCIELEKYLKANSDTILLNPQYISYMHDQESKNSKVSQVS